jgi:hypothetical protein
MQAERKPLTLPDCNLRDVPHFELDIARLLDSDFFAKSDGSEFKAAIALWLKSWWQVPAASPPNDDAVLAVLSGTGDEWQFYKKMALHGWIKCSDGRLYHPVVAEKAREALERRAACPGSAKGSRYRMRKMREERARVFEALGAAGLHLPAAASTSEVRRAHGALLLVEKPGPPGGPCDEHRASSVTDRALPAAARQKRRSNHSEGLRLTARPLVATTVVEPFGQPARCAAACS